LSRLQKIPAARLDPQARSGLTLTAGIALLLVAVCSFGLVAASVTGGGAITVLDLRLASWFHEHAAAGLTPVFLLLTHLHSIASMSLFGALLGLYFYRKQARYWLLLTLIAVPGGMLLNALLKFAFMRARPSFHDPILTLLTYSFPSGHTAATTVFYGIIAAYLCGKTSGWRAPCAIAAAALLMVLLVGLSRIYLGVHYFSDVLAAMAESCAWLVVCIAAVAMLRRRRERTAPPDG
jgi:undecaprenyl-diphosphatase